MNLKTNLKHLLAQNDMTASQLSRKSNVPKTTLGEWLAGGNPRDLNKVKQVADVFEVTVDELCFGNGSPKRQSLKDFEEEIFAGNFDVILRKAKR